MLYHSLTDFEFVLNICYGENNGGEIWKSDEKCVFLHDNNVGLSVYFFFEREIYMVSFAYL